MRKPLGFPHFLRNFALFMQMMYNRFEDTIKYDKYVEQMLRKYRYLQEFPNFDREFAGRDPVEKPVESVNNFLNMRCITGKCIMLIHKKQNFF